MDESKRIWKGEVWPKPSHFLGYPEGHYLCSGTGARPRYGDCSECVDSQRGVPVARRCPSECHTSLGFAVSVKVGHCLRGGSSAAPVDSACSVNCPR
jgi:hypothetical protein